MNRIFKVLFQNYTYSGGCRFADMNLSTKAYVYVYRAEGSSENEGATPRALKYGGRRGQHIEIDFANRVFEGKKDKIH